jgi:hypothetical protein
MTPDLSGLALDFELTLNDCPEPVFLQSNVTIPEVRLIDSPTCKTDLSEKKCLAVGGRMSDGKTTAPYCICP